jgi:hypothetical protein
MALDPALVDQMTILALRGANRQSDLADQAGRDNASLLLFDHRSLSSAIAGEIAMSDSPDKAMTLNTAARIPSTLEHPAYVPGTPQPKAP